ncbi:MAG: hypothetical protein JNJ99_16825 [Crocinitomicaceae bacterium]|nr:hypothetical protein [Crocinitomicaceae bacterium]
MKLEHKSEKVVSVNRFVFRVGKYAFYSGILVLFSLMLGSIGYHFFAGLSWIDSFHMSSMILTGMGPTVEMPSASAKLFSSFFALYSGIAFLTITAVFLAPVVHRLMHILHLENDDEK